LKVESKNLINLDWVESQVEPN